MLSDEKFARLDGEAIFLFVVSQEELIWYTDPLKQSDEEAFAPAIANFLESVNQGPIQQKQHPGATPYAPKTATTDGWKPVQNACRSEVEGINLLECRAPWTPAYRPHP